MEKHTPTLRATAKRPRPGSLVNWIVSNDQTLPIAGDGATICLWSDRHAYWIADVNYADRSVTLERAKCIRADNLGMSDSQSYRYERGENPSTITLYLRWNGWRHRHMIDGQTFHSEPVNVVFGWMNEYYDFSF
jgi:hypothetical protein